MVQNKNNILHQICCDIITVYYFVLLHFADFGYFVDFAYSGYLHYFVLLYFLVLFLIVHFLIAQYYFVLFGCFASHYRFLHLQYYFYYPVNFDYFLFHYFVYSLYFVLVVVLVLLLLLLFVHLLAVF